MTSTTLSLSLNTARATTMLSALADAAKRFPEFRDAVADLIKAGEQLFALDVDRRAAASAGELVVLLEPTDGLRSLVSAFRARDFDLSLVEQLMYPPTEAVTIARDGRRVDG